MQHYDDLYGLLADQRVFIEEEEALIDTLAERLAELLDVDLEGYYSEAQGGECYRRAFPEDKGFEHLHIYIYPNHIVEPDGDYWLEEDLREFALLLNIGSATKSLVEGARAAIKGTPDLNLTLIRSIYSPDLRGDRPDVVEFSLSPENTRG